MPYLAKDIYSLLNRYKCYGEKGDTIEIISESSGVFIIERKKDGNRFSILRDEFTDDEPAATPRDKLAETQPPIVKGPASRKPKRSQPDHSATPIQTQGSLF